MPHVIEYRRCHSNDDDAAASLSRSQRVKRNVRPIMLLLLCKPIRPTLDYYNRLRIIVIIVISDVMFCGIDY